MYRQGAKDGFNLVLLKNSSEGVNIILANHKDRESQINIRNLRRATP